MFSHLGEAGCFGKHTRNKNKVNAKPMMLMSRNDCIDYGYPESLTGRTHQVMSFLIMRNVVPNPQHPNQCLALGATKP